MADQPVKVSFNVSTRLLGCDAELFDGTSVRLGPDADRPFQEASTGKRFSIDQMLTNLMVKTNTRKEDLVRRGAAAEAFEKGRCVGKPDLDMTFAPGSLGLY